jgi:hypothetical protein
MKDLLLNEQTRQIAESFIQKPSHALIISGPAGSGKSTLADSIIKDVLELSGGDSPYVRIISPEEGKSSVGITAVRELDHFFSLKVPVKTAFNRAVILENAHGLTLEAQNALLKVLEEPPDNSLVILATASEQALLPTIRSRAQILPVSRPSGPAVAAYFKDLGYSEPAVKQAYSISGGLPGLMSALLSDDNHPLKQAVQTARQLLSQSLYERLLSVDELARNKQLALDTSFILQQMAHVSLQSAQGKASQKWQNVLKAGYETGEALAQSAQPKLALTSLMLNL